MQSVKQNMFDPDEYWVRFTKIFEAVPPEVDVLLLTSPESIYYATGYQTFGESPSYLCLERRGSIVFVLRELESALAAATSYVSAVATFTDVDDPLELVCRTLLELADGRSVTIGAELASLNMSAFRMLTEKLGGGAIADVSDAVGGTRVVKSDAEIEAIERAAAYTDAGLLAAYAAARSGVTENDIAAAGYRAMIEAGSEWLANDPIVTSGRRSSVAHTTFCRRELVDGDVVLLEFGACHFRYFSPLMRSVVIGSVGDDVRRRFDVCRDALQASLAVMRPGARSGDVHNAAQQVIDGAGLHDEFKKRMGYSVGLGFRTWSEGKFFDLKQGDQRLLEKNMVFHLPPALRLPGAFGLGLSSTVVVTDTGVRTLSDLPQELIVK